MTLLDEDKIRKQAKAIMDEFIKALERVENIPGEAGLERDDFARKGKAAKCDTEFRKRMLKNAPRKEGSFVVAERKSW